jgi:hypothetical protein
MASEFDHGEMVNGGDYAHVIRGDDPVAPAPQTPSRERGQGPDGGSPGTSAGPARSAGGAGRGRAITAGAVSAGWPASTDGPPEAARPGTVPDVDQALAYGPDDPAYGPPGPDWYQRDEERAPRTQDAVPPATAGESRATRGPFEPLSPVDRAEAGYADYQSADGEPVFDGDQVTGPSADEMPELLDFGTPTDPDAGALGQVRDLYETAETLGQASLDTHIDQLLERQRKLISEYFAESGALGSFADLAPPEPPASLGFDTAQSLTGLRGELR